MVPKSCYDCLKPNESILISQPKVSVSDKGQIHEGDTKVYLDLVPDAGIHIYASFPMFFSSIDKLALDGNDVPGFVTRQSTIFPINKIGGTDFIWHPSTEPIIGRGDQNTKMVSVVFHLFNYIDIMSTYRTSERIGSAAYAIHHVDLKASGWNVELKSLPTTSDTFKILDEKGGYGLTHVGCFQREDGASFDGKTAKEILNTLCFFLSLSKGMWYIPCLAVGFDVKENRTWESWASPRGGWAKPSSWFDPHHCEQLVNLFPGFVKRWENEDWQEALHEVIYWYLNSNDFEPWH